MRRVWAWCRDNPVASLVFAGGAVAGAVLATHYELGPAELDPWKRALGGALAGAWLAMFPLGFRLFE